jgi:hypothetical protein
VHDRYLKLVKALCPPGRTLHPPRQGLPVDGNALEGKHLCLAIECRAPSVSLRGDPSNECRRGHTALDQRWTDFRLNDRALTGSARIFRPDRAQYPQDC